MMLGPINLLPKISNNICQFERFLQKLEKLCLRMLVNIIKLEEDENKGACSSLFQLVPASCGWSTCRCWASRGRLVRILEGPTSPFFRHQPLQKRYCSETLRNNFKGPTSPSQRQILENCFFDSSEQRCTQCKTCRALHVLKPFRHN